MAEYIDRNLIEWYGCDFEYRIEPTNTTIVEDRVIAHYEMNVHKLAKG